MANPNRFVGASLDDHVAKSRWHSQVKYYLLSGRQSELEEYVSSFGRPDGVGEGIVVKDHVTDGSRGRVLGSLSGCWDVKGRLSEALWLSITLSGSLVVHRDTGGNDSIGESH